MDGRAREGCEAHGEASDAIDDCDQSEEIDPALVPSCPIKVKDGVREEEEGWEGSENITDAVERGVMGDLGEGMEAHVVQALSWLMEVAGDIGKD